MKKILFKLFFVIAIVELLLMGLLSLLDFGPTFFWLPMLLDALLISITAILTVSVFIKKGLFLIRQQGLTTWIEIQIGLIVFFIEILIMQLFEYQPWDLAAWQEMLIDGLSLAFFSALGIYFIVLKPVLEGQKINDVTVASFDSTKITVVFGYCSVITVLLMFLVLSYQQQYEGLQMDMIEREVSSQKLFKTAFVQQLDQVVNDVLSISEQVNVVEFLEDLSLQKKQHLIDDFQIQAKYKPEYEQLRLLDNSGQELIRIEQAENGVPVAVGDYALQDKSERYYFKESLLLNKSQVYISKIDLNKEYGEIELPYKPVIRVATTVMSSNEILGIVVLNLKAKKMLDALAQFYTLGNSSRQLLDESGHWLFGRDIAKQQGFIFIDDELVSIAKEHPGLWAALQQTKQGVYELDQEQAVFQSIAVGGPLNSAKSGNISNRTSWYLLSFIANNIVTNQLDGTLTMMVYFYIFISLLLGLGSYLLILALRQKKIAESKTLLMVYSDTLTGLKNRKYFQWKLVREMQSAKLQQSKLAIFYIDLNRFKTINDEMGHEAGDLVLKKVASILLQCLRDDDTVARIGGDEFAAILPNVVSDQGLEDICNRITLLIAEGLDIGGMNLYLGINVGIATMNNYDEPVRSFIARADQAMYESKTNESRSFVFADQYRTI